VRVVTARRVGAAVALAAVLLVPLAGCRGGAAAGPAAPPVPAGTADPLGGVDVTLDAVEEQLSEDGRTDG
jgi:hypothetical protein